MHWTCRKILLILSFLSVVFLLTAYHSLSPCGITCFSIDKTNDILSKLVNATLSHRTYSDVDRSENGEKGNNNAATDSTSVSSKPTSAATRVSVEKTDSAAGQIRVETPGTMSPQIQKFKSYAKLCPHGNDSCPSYDNWPQISGNKKLPRSPYTPTKPVFWAYDYTEFLRRPDVVKGPPKIITWMVKPRYWPDLAEPVRMRHPCPEMPCRLTTNWQKYQNQSAALIWNGQIMRRNPAPPRAHKDQVYVFHNDEPQKNDWTPSAGFRHASWTSAFNWTMTYRLDSDLFSPYGIIVQRGAPADKNYTAIWEKKAKFAAWMVGHCHTQGGREEFVKQLQKYVSVDVYGGCGQYQCPRNADDKCFQTFSTEYKFFLAFENAFCEDYVSEKFFRYLELDSIVIARGSSHKKFAPNGTYINTEDFSSIKDLADRLKYLATHKEEYLKILKAKDKYVPVYDDYPIRSAGGPIQYMEYHYEAVPFCEMCLRLWNLQDHRKYCPNISAWFDKANCYNKPLDKQMFS